MISDYMKIRLADWPEMATARSVLQGNKQIIMIGGREVSVSPFASDTEIEVALRLAFSRPKATTMPETSNGNGATDKLETEGAALAAVPADQSAEAPASTPLPPRPTLAATAASPVRRPVVPGSFGASLRAMLDEARNSLDAAQANGRARVQDAVNKLGTATDATHRVSETIAQQIEDSADAALSELSQISNSL